MDGKTIVYDITSTYFEKTKCTLAFKGYSRDHRSDKLQIVIALAVTPQGYPFYWKVYQGNTPDVNTVEDFTETIIRLFGVTDLVFVFDRGMVSQTNIDFIEGRKYRYISAIDRNEIQTSTPVDVNQFEGVDGPGIEKLPGFIKYDDGLWYREYNDGGKRHIIGFSPQRQADDRLTRGNRIKRLENGISGLNANLSQAKRSRSKDAVSKLLAAMLNKSNIKKAVNASIEDMPVVGKVREIMSFKVTYVIDQKVLSNMKLTDGLTCFFTNTSPDDYTAAQVIQQYREKNVVEEGFHEIKGIIELRPIYLSLEDRVRAHVTVCIMAYLLYNTLEKKVSRSMGFSASDILLELGRCKINTLAVMSGKEKINVMTQITSDQKEILKHLGYAPKLVEKDFNKVVNAGGYV
jgi:transposase